MNLISYFKFYCRMTLHHLLFYALFILLFIFLTLIDNSVCINSAPSYFSFLSYLAISLYCIMLYSLRYELINITNSNFHINILLQFSFKINSFLFYFYFNNISLSRVPYFLFK